MAECNKDLCTSKTFGHADIEAGSRIGHVSDPDRKTTPPEAPLMKMRDGRKNHVHVDDIDKWAGSLTRILEDVPQYMCRPGHPGRIGRIPYNLREVDLKAYEPYNLSIGPYHYGKPMMSGMEMTKQAILKCVLEQNPDITLIEYLTEIKSIEPKARSFYSDIEMDSEIFVRMLLLDSMFILLKFCGTPRSHRRMKQINVITSNGVVIEDMNERAEQINQSKEEADDENMQMIIRFSESNSTISSAENYETPPAWFWALFVHDLFLLENQLPLFVLQKIYDIAYGTPKTQLIDILKYHIGQMLWDYTKLDSGVMISQTEEVHHLLHLCHMFFRPTLQRESISFQLRDSHQFFRLGSAVQLHEAGVRFEPRSNSTQHTLLDITFDNSGIMILPCLNVDDNTTTLLRNLVALEQMKYPQLGLDVSSYVVLLLHLITTPEDVNLLRRKGIIQHHLASDKEMVHLINQLSVGLSFDYVEDRYRLKPVFQELKRYTELRVPRWRAWLRHRYFHNPWTVITLLAASLLLFLNALQTFYIVYSYYQ